MIHCEEDTMIPYREQKIKNAIAYFASEFHNRRNYYPRQTWIYKFIALLDFRVLKKTGMPCLGLEYNAMQFGPVPRRLYDARDGLETDKFCFVATADGGSRVESKGVPEIDYFSDDELDVMDEILDVYAQGGVDLETLIRDAHKEIKAWNKAWSLAQQVDKGKMPMDYADEFEGLKNKSPEDLTLEEERFLHHQDMTELENLEAL